MAQAWHKQREQLVEGTQTSFWRATDYRLDSMADPPVLESAADALWERSAPFDWYRPISTAREVSAGPHLTFLRLKRIWEEQPDLFPKALILFAKDYGFLGAFEEDYLPPPLFPERKMLLAPEAVIDNQGRLKRVDPATEGRELLLDLLEPRGWLEGYKKRKAKHRVIALPSEARWNPTTPNLDSSWWPVFPPRHLVPWDVIK